jgi:hypothetical protein
VRFKVFGEILSDLKKHEKSVLPTSCALTFLMYVQDVGCGNRDEYHDDCKQDPPGYGRT